MHKKLEIHLYKISKNMVDIIYEKIYYIVSTRIVSNRTTWNENERDGNMGEDAGKWINLVSHQLKRQIFCQDHKENGQDNLTNMQKHILHFILLETMHRDLYQKDLEKEFKVRRSTATGTLQLLERKGYIYREPVKEDARLKRIVPTESALSIRKSLLENISRREKQIREGIADEDMEVFMRVLKKISANLSDGEKTKDSKNVWKGRETDE